MGTDPGVLERARRKLVRTYGKKGRELRALRQWQVNMRQLVRNTARREWQRFNSLVMTAPDFRPRDPLAGARQVQLTKGDVLLMERISLRWMGFPGRGVAGSYEGDFQYPPRVWKRIKHLANSRYFDGSLPLKVVGEVLGFKNLAIRLVKVPLQWLAAKWHRAEQRFEVWLDN